jgi:hypothetical protein
MINAIGKMAAIVVLAASGQASCSGPKIQNTHEQDLSTFAKCDDAQGHGTVHPCTTRKEDGTWIVWVVGVADCPAITVQPKSQVECLNEQK